MRVCVCETEIKEGVRRDNSSQAEASGAQEHTRTPTVTEKDPFKLRPS